MGDQVLSEKLGREAAAQMIPLSGRQVNRPIDELERFATG